MTACRQSTWYQLLSSERVAFHRYGESIPADITSTDDLETLSVEQALADAAAFVAFVTGTWLQQKQLVWVSVGGSYPGALSAWFREQCDHPVALVPLIPF